MKNGSPEMAPRVTAHRKQLLAPDPPRSFFFHKWWLPMLEYVCPGSQGWAKEPPACGGSQETAPGGGQQPLAFETAATKLPIFFCCYEGFPMFLEDGRVWLYLANKAIECFCFTVSFHRSKHIYTVCNMRI